MRECKQTRGNPVGLEEGLSFNKPLRTVIYTRVYLNAQTLPNIGTIHHIAGRIPTLPLNTGVETGVVSGAVEQLVPLPVPLLVLKEGGGQKQVFPVAELVSPGGHC